MNCKGFTLIELMVTVVLAAVVLTIGVPSLKTLIDSNRLTAATNDFVSAITLARAEAIKRGSFVAVCASDARLSDNTGQQRCTGTDWGGGYLIFADAARGCTVAAVGDIIRATRLTANMALTTTRGGAAVACVRFRGDGAADAGHENTQYTLQTAGKSATRCTKATGRLESTTSCAVSHGG